MKKTNVINAHVSSLLAGLGHTDSICIADAGLPIPSAAQRIDLALRPGIPGFLDVLVTVLEEMVVERVVLAEEIRDNNPGIHSAVQELCVGIPIDYVSHEKFKKLTSTNRGIIRSGECTPYANIILYSGVAF